eukprot:6483244-Amphidinium_carterae.1
MVDLPNAQLTKMAAIVKPKLGGERLVLPRLGDAAASAVDLLEGVAQESVVLAVIDLSDAFYTLAAREAEREVLVVRASTFGA